MPSIVLHCPNCQQPYQMSPELIAKYAGRTITCRKCKQPFGFDAAMDTAAQLAGRAEAAAEAPDAPPSAPPAPSGAATRPGGARSGRGAADASAVAAQGYAEQPTPASRENYAAVPAAPPPPPPQPAEPYAPATFPQPPGYPPAPAAPPGFAPPPPYAAAPAASTFSPGDLFTFRRMALPHLLPLVFWLGVAWSVYNGLGTLSHLVFVPRYGYGLASISTHFSPEGLASRIFSIYGLNTIMEALFWLTLGPLFWRGFCELLLAASRLPDRAPRP